MSESLVYRKEEIKSAADELKDEQELERMLGKMTLRQRRSYMRKLERGEDVDDINEDDLDDFELSDEDEDEDDEDEQDRSP